MIRALVLALVTGVLLAACTGGGAGKMADGALYGQALPPPDATRARRSLEPGPTCARFRRQRRWHARRQPRFRVRSPRRRR